MKLTPEEIGEKFEKEFGTRSDYFNHRVGLFMEMKKWIVDQIKIVESRNKTSKP